MVITIERIRKVKQKHPENTASLKTDTGGIGPMNAKRALHS